MNSLFRLLVTSFFFIFITACGGGTPAPAPTPAPTITSFVTSSATSFVGFSVNLTAVFANGTGNIDNGVGSVTSGITKLVSPASTTTYTLTVTNSAGSIVTSSVTITVTTASRVQISWNSNPETAVNQSGGGYKVFYSPNSGFSISDGGIAYVDVPYVTGATTPTTALIQPLPPSGTYYIRVVAYSALQAPGTTFGGTESAATAETTLLVP